MNKNVILEAGLRFYNPEVQKKALDIVRAKVLNQKVSEDDYNKAITSIRSYLMLPYAFEKVQDKSNAIMSYTSKRDIDEITHNLFDVVTDMKYFDTFSMEAFKEMQFDENRDDIELVNAENLVTFEKTEEGESVKFYKIKSSNTYIKAQYYTAGLEIPFQIYETRQYSRIIDNLNEMRNAYFESKYNTLYKILVAAGQSNATITYQSGANTAESDIKTINEAVYKLNDDNKKKTGINASNYPCIFYANLRLADRINGAIKYSTYNASNISTTITSKPIIVYATNSLEGLSSTQALALLPGRRIVYATKIEPQIYQAQNLNNLTELTVARYGFAAAVADIEQVVVVNFA